MKIKKILAYLVAAALAVTAIPLSAFAESEEEIEEIFNDLVSVSYDDEYEGYVAQVQSTYCFSNLSSSIGYRNYIDNDNNNYYYIEYYEIMFVAVSVDNSKIDTMTIETLDSNGQSLDCLSATEKDITDGVGVISYYLTSECVKDVYGAKFSVYGSSSTTSYYFYISLTPYIVQVTIDDSIYNDDSDSDDTDSDDTDYLEIGTYDDFEYMDDGTVSIVGYIGDGGDVVIPSEINGKAVTEIGKNAFTECTSITSITIPDSVISIKDGGHGINNGSEYGAFSGCTSLETVNLGSGIKTIGGNAFCYCTSLTSITIPDNVTWIGNYAFGCCTSLETIDLGNGIETIDDETFYKCTSLTSITIPDSVTAIGDCAFEHCTSLETVDLGNGVETIGDYAFFNCRSLTSLTIPDSVTAIGDGAFNYCTSLETVDLGSGVVTIGSCAFNGTGLDGSISGRTSLTEINVDSDNEYYASDDGVLFNKDITELIQYPAGKEDTEYVIPDSVTSINSHAFYGCTSLTSITIPDGVTYIGSDALFYCISLTSIEIPDSVTYIDSYAFYCCTSLSDVYYTGTEEQWNEIYIDDSNYSLLNATIHYESTLPDFLLGDLDNNGSVTAWDSVLLARYLAHWDITINESAADLDGSGTITAWDGVLLARQLAGWSD